MGVLLTVLDTLKPVIAASVKNRVKRERRGSSDYASSSRSVEIPPQIMNMKEIAADAETRSLALKFSKLLELENLAGPDNMFSQIARGNGLKGRLIRSFVFSQALKKDVSDSKRLFLQMLMDTTITNTPEIYVNSVIAAFGDSAESVRDKAKEVGFEVLLDISDEDFESMANNFI